ncbi:MAG TPA: hypothetical protein PLK14_05300 [Sediminibacterium sp.]|nr:hypothetical protein [Sediminibacterium sp.]
MKQVWIFASLVFLLFESNAQQSGYEIKLEPLSIKGLVGVQSFAHASIGTNWVVIGGRIDGLHRRQPFASFDKKGNNLIIQVIDPLNQQTWQATTNELDSALQDQLSATNMQFYQDKAYLYIIGGYGFSTQLNKHTTYASLIAIDIAGLIESIKHKQSIKAHFRKISHPEFAVTGGQLKKIGQTYYLIGGQNFQGRYNPMGPDHGPGFFQEYSNQIKQFTISDNGINLEIQHFKSIRDSLAFHRRDYNVVPQIMPDEKQGLTAFSGVFQETENIPYLNAVNITAQDYQIHPSFAQYYNHYHSANLGLYSAQNNEMHTLFFGGIAQYYDSANYLVQNTDVPFVKTIAAVVRDKNAVMTEYKLPIEMPGYMGAGAEFIPTGLIATYDNHVIKLDELGKESILVGYIFGGINSQASNIFWTNTGKESIASNSILKVYLKINTTQALGKINQQSNNGIQLQASGSISDDFISLRFNLIQKGPVSVQLLDNKHQLVTSMNWDALPTGANQLKIPIVKPKNGANYWIRLTIDKKVYEQKMVIEP